MDAKREMGNSNFEIIIAKHETTVSNPEIRKKMMADGLDMGWLSIGLMGQWISGQVGGVVVIGVAIEPRDIDMKKHHTEPIGIRMMLAVVGATGFEPATTWSQTRSATGLRYTPLYLILILRLQRYALIF